MWSVIGLWFSKNWLTVAQFAAAGLAAAGLLIGARNSGRQAERVDELKKSAEIKDAQLKAATRRPRNRSELADRMRSNDF